MIGFEKCDKCNGIGIYTFPSKNWDHCAKCKGVGRISWIEKIFGKDSYLSDGDLNLRYKNEKSYLRERELIRWNI